MKHLGKESYYPTEPSRAILEAVALPDTTPDLVARFTCPEMTSLCPVTGQPDFATIVIDYVPFHHIVESKSLKLYLFSYRNHPGFHETTTAQIMLDLVAVLNPVWMRVAGFWMPRGGIPIDVVLSSGLLPPTADVLPLPSGASLRNRA